MLSCTTSKEARSSRIELKKEKRLAEQALIKKAVESKKFIIRFDRLYYSYGGMIDLIPRSNYIIIDGRKAIISAGYIGRQYDIRPIAGINMHGEATNYEVKFNSSKGIYEIKIKVTNKFNSFDVYLTIGNNGSCSASLNNVKIDYIRYSGQLVPLKNKMDNSQQQEKSDNTQQEEIAI